MSLDIVLVYQSLLGIYGDQGNAMVLHKRAEWRDIDARIIRVEPGDELPVDADLFVIGGGEDGAQTAAVKALTEDGNLFRAVDRGAVVFGVCAGYQLLGKSFCVGADDEPREGLGLLDVTSSRGPERAVGEILTRWIGRSGDEAWLTGFENHAGYTRLGADAKPLATVEVGVGNGFDATEGAVQGNIIGTYPHGPVLARNPALADHLLELALGRELDQLDSPEHDILRQQRLAAVQLS